jgi:hypothetical protein
MKILRLINENVNWVAARRTPYAIQQGLDRCLRDLGHEVTTLNPYYSRYAPQLLPSGSHRFDQVWMDLNQSGVVDQQWGDWLARVAPVRLGLFPESLNYVRESLDGQPFLARFKSDVASRLPSLTHVLFGDEADQDYFESHGLPAMWWVQSLPSRLIREVGTGRGVGFFGTLYGARGDWLKDPAISQHLHAFESPESGTPLPWLFDLTMLSMRIVTRLPFTRIDALRRPLIRSTEVLRYWSLRNWLKCLSSCAAVVNLPSAYQAYPGRVTEAMGVSRCVISWRVPNRPRNSALFEEGTEIALFSDRQELLEHLERAQREPSWTRRMGLKALSSMRSHHGLEQRTREILHWIDSGEVPFYARKLAEHTSAANTSQ